MSDSMAGVYAGDAPWVRAGCQCAACDPAAPPGTAAINHLYPAPHPAGCMCPDCGDQTLPEQRQLGVKHRKLARFDLIPKDVLWEVAEVLGWGASNRGDSERNWEQGLQASDLVAGIYRHVSQWESGEQEDEDTGKSHLAHAICLLMFLRGLEMRGLLLDDRGKPFGPLRSELVS